MKILLAKEIIEAMIFLGIPTEKFCEMKKEHKSIENLHNYLSLLLS